MISEFLFFEENATKIEQCDYINLKIEIRELIKDEFNRKVLSGILLDLQKDVSGITKKRVFKLYQELGLQEDAYAKLKSWRWEVVSQGILELTQMQVTEAYGFITKFINDKRGVIRKQAEIATVTLKHEGINYFLDSTTCKISEWQQLKLLDVIRNLEGFQPPKFKAWLTSGNSYVVLFALRLIKYYNQNDAYSSIIELVKHSNNQIKAEAIGCIREFNILEARDTLKLVFYKCTTDSKLLILDTLAIFGQREDISFLQMIENKETNFSVKSKALSAINAIHPESIMPTEGIQHISTNQIPDIILTMPEETIGQNISAEKQSLVVEAPEETNEPSEMLLNYDLEASQVREGCIDSGKEEILEFNFLPFVIENETEFQGVLNSEVIFEEIQGAEILNELEEVSDITKVDGYKLLDFDFIPFVYEDEKQIEKDQLQIKEEEIRSILVNYEQVDLTIAVPDEINSSINEDINTVLKSEEKDEVHISSTLEEQEDKGFQIPPPCFVHDLSVTASMEDFLDKPLSNVELLEAIEEFGDKREIPLLEEMRDDEEMEDFRTQILGLIERFSDKNSPLKKDPITTENTAELYSVFEEFFQKYDTDSKVLLLEEIAFVGDEKELYFLSKLISDSELRIRECAKRVHQELKKRLESDKNDQSENKEDQFNLKEVNESGSTTTSYINEVDIAIGNEIASALKENTKKSSDLIPLEFCFLLNQLEIKEPKNKSIFEVDFELETNIYEPRKEESHLNTKWEVGISKNEDYSPDSLSSNCAKSKNKRNG